MVRGSKRRRTFLSVMTGSLTAGLAGCFGGGGNGNGNGGSDGNGSDGGNGDTGDPEDQVPDADETVLVGPDEELVFEPDSLEVEPGTTVAFVWESNGHNILTGSMPDGAEWEGQRATKESGFAHGHTFEVEGIYEYRCGQHQFQGMDGEVIVGDVDTGEGGDGNGDGNETDGSDNETDGSNNETDGNETDGSDGSDNETDGSNNETDGSSDAGNETDDGE